MEKELNNFYNNIKSLENNLSKYEDEKGNLFIIPTTNLILSCSYIEVEEKDLKVALFNGTLEKNVEYNKIVIKSIKDKSTITGKSKDKGILVDSEVNAYQVWIVKNSLGIQKSYSSKDEALEIVNRLNKDILNNVKI
jgi:hypothetical protein